jgi:hypothetical protein
VKTFSMTDRWFSKDKRSNGKARPLASGKAAGGGQIGEGSECAWERMRGNKDGYVLELLRQSKFENNLDSR